MDDQTALALLAAAGLALAHVLAGRVHSLGGVPRSRWLSAFGGVSVAYVFAHLLPELAEGQRAIEGEPAQEGAVAEGPILGFLEHHVYLMGLVGLGVFYAVEQHSLRRRRQLRRETGEDRTTPDAFWLSIASFAAYNVIVGYLLLRGDLEEAGELGLYALALGVHFVVNDVGLHDHHQDAYERLGRWILVAAVFAGWLLGAATDVPERVIALVLAFVGGGVILNVLKEELPGERQARLAPFAAGAVGYAALLQVA